MARGGPFSGRMARKGPFLKYTLYPHSPPYSPETRYNKVMKYIIKFSYLQTHKSLKTLRTIVIYKHTNNKNPLKIIIYTHIH